MRVKRVKSHLADYLGEAHLYELSEPLVVETYDEDRPNIVVNHVVISATVAPFSGPETFIYPAKADGEVASWMELPGSYRGGLSHTEAIAGAGWEIES